MMLYGIVLTVHLFVSIVLVGVILLQAGKGGLAETMGGSTAQSILGTSAGTFLTRATAVCAVLFMVTCISLTILSSRHTGSLLLQQRRGLTMPTPAPSAPVPKQGASAPETTTPVTSTPPAVPTTAQPSSSTPPATSPPPSPDSAPTLSP